MEPDERTHWHELIKVYTQRLYVLERQKARYGNDCPPHIQIEIEDIKEYIENLEERADFSTKHYYQPDQRNDKTSTPISLPNDPSSGREHRERIDCPYPGMRPFHAGEAKFFHGRETEIQQMLRSLRYQRCLFVIGPSGSGKSSLIYAGLLPRLQESTFFPTDYWLVRSMRPSNQPAETLASIIGDHPDGFAQAVIDLLAIHPPAQRLLLIVDQFEELFTQSDRAKQLRFITILKALQDVKDCTLLITMRADFYPDLMTSDLWSVALKKRLEITPLRGEALRQAIQRPAADVGVHLENDLIERLLADAADEPGVLPLLQETMVLLWEQMEGRILTLSAYEQLGSGGRSGLAVALATKADATLDELPPIQQAIARRIFLRLVQFGEGRADTRRQLSLPDLQSSRDDQELFGQTLQHLTENRLLTLSGEENASDRKVDLAHEVLITGWPTLQVWIAERRETEQTRRSLESKVAEWIRMGRGKGGLLDTAELPEAEQWLASADANELGYHVALPDLVHASRIAVEKAEEQRRQEEAQYRIIEELRKINQMSRALHQPLLNLTRELGTTHNLDEPLTHFLEQLVNIVGVNGAGIVLIPPDGSRLYSKIPLQSAFVIDNILFEKIAGWVLDQHQPMIIEDAHNDPRWFAEVSYHTTVRSIAAIPIVRNGQLLVRDEQLLGILILVHHTSGYFSNELVDLLLSVATQSAIALENFEFFKLIRDQKELMIEDDRSMLNAVLSGAADPILLIGLENQLLLANRAAEQRLGISAAPGQPINTLNIHPDLLRIFNISKDQNFTMPYEVTLPTGETFSISSAPVYGADSQLIGHAIVFQDITAIKELEQREQERLRAVLRRYVSPAVVEQMLAGGGEFDAPSERDVVVLFADLRGYTALTEGVAPGVLVEQVLNRYFTAMTDVLYRYAGTIDKFLGDGIIGVFGTPIAHVDDVQRSLAAAVDLQRTFAKLHRSWQIELGMDIGMGVGMGYGSAIVGNIGSTQRLDYTLVGDVVNTASRLGSLARPGQILVSHDLIDALPPDWQIPWPLRPMDRVLLKGKQEPHLIYEIEYDML